jgi:hypothetical protein
MFAEACRSSRAWLPAAHLVLYFFAPQHEV